MRQEISKEAMTIEEAQKAIATELGVPQEQIDFVVVREPQKKMLGLFGGCTAVVRGCPKPSKADAAVAYVESVLEAMHVTGTKIAVKNEESGCVLSLQGEDLGFIIGRRGDTLDALQYLTGLVANRAENDGTYERVTIDIGNYREKREQTLIGLARKMGAQVVRSGRKSSLEPMNPYERRIIHTAVQDMKGVTSWSVGSEPARHVVIGPEGETATGKPAAGKPAMAKPPMTKPAAKPATPAMPAAPRAAGTARPARPARPAEPTGTARPARPEVAPERPVRQFVPRENPLPTADGATPPSKTASEKENSASLYGRIDL